MSLKERIVIFIDGSNFYHELTKNFGKIKIDFSTFAKFLTGNNKLVQIYYYNVPLNQKDNPKEYRRQQKFFSYLSRIPNLEIKLGRLEKRPKGVLVEKGVDVRIAVDIVTHAYANIYDSAILVSGDADFVPAIRAVQDFGKEVINVCLPKTKSFHLNQTCNKTITLSKINIQQILWKK